VSYGDGGMSPRLTPEQRDAVLTAKPMVNTMLTKLMRMFRHVPFEDMRQIVWQGVSEVAPHHDPSQGSFEAFAWKRVFGKTVDWAMREARQSPLYLAQRAFLPVTDLLQDPDDPFDDDEQTLSPLREVCHDGASRMFFGATFETWRIQGEQSLVDHMTRLKAFRGLQGAFTTLNPDEWKLLELYYIDCHSWLEVGQALGISDRHAKRRAEEIREKLKRELRLRGIKEAPPLEEG
jgi:RNA polymerase sigma factor (sigma-70 family)